MQDWVILITSSCLLPHIGLQHTVKRRWTLNWKQAERQWAIHYLPESIQDKHDWFLNIWSLIFSAVLLLEEAQLQWLVTVGLAFDWSKQSLGN